jgi:hypothetical protein
MLSCGQCSRMRMEITRAISLIWNGPIAEGANVNFLPAHYGTVEVTLVTDQRVFFSLLDEICKESVHMSPGINFYGQRVSLLDAFMQHRLFGVSVAENDSMFRKDSMMDALFMVEGFYDIPCFCITAKQSPDTVELLWAADRARGFGIEELVMDQLRLKPI